jgi:hypothetical protein
MRREQRQPQQAAEIPPLDLLGLRHFADAGVAAISQQILLPEAGLAPPASEWQGR